MKNRKIERIVYNGENVEDKVGRPNKKVFDEFILDYFAETEPGEEIEFNQYI